MTPIRLLNHGKLPPALADRLARACDVHTLANEADPKAFLARHDAGITTLVTSRRPWAPTPR